LGSGGTPSAAESARLAVLRAYRVLDTPPEPAYDDLTRLAAEICGAPIALLTFVDEDRQWFKARQGIDLVESPRAWSFCAHAMLHQDVMVVPDTLADERFRENPFVTGAPGVRFYAGAPLRAPEGHALGALAVVDLAPRTLAAREQAALRALGREALAQLETRRERGTGGEEVFRALVELSADATALVTREASFSYASPATLRVLGHAPEEILGHSVFGVMHPDDRPRCRELFLRCLKSPGERLSVEFRVRRKDGAWREIEADGVNRLDEPTVRGVLVSFRDVTEKRRAEDEVRSHADLAANLLAVARATTEQSDLERTLERALQVLTSLTGAEGGSLLLFDEDETLTRRVFSPGRFAVPQDAPDVEGILERGLAGWVVRRRQAALIPDTRQDERWWHIPGREAALSAVAVPICVAGSLAGILTLVHSDAGHFKQEHLDLLQTADEQLALALRNAQFVDTLGQLARREQALNSVLKAAASRLDPEEVLSRAVNAMVGVTGWHSIHVGLLSEDRRSLCVSAGTRGPAPGTLFSLTEGIAGRAFTTGQTQLVGQVERDPDYQRLVSDGKSQLCVPIRHGERTLGVLNIASEREDAFAPDDVRLAEALSDAVGLALANASLHRAVAAEGERLSSLIEASRDGVLFSATEGTIHVLNEPAGRLLGLAGPATSWLGRTVEQLAQRLRELGAVASAGVLSVKDGEGDFESSAGIVRYLAQDVRSQGSTLGRLLVLRDVTAERRAELLREDLSHTMVHDLRSPLTTILGSLEYVSHTSPSVQEGLALANRAARRLLALVDAILDLTRLEKGAMPLRRTPQDLFQLVSEALALQAPAAGVQATSEIPAQLPAVLADPELVARVLQNLLGNALKSGARRVTVGAQVEAGVVRIQVRDDGPGIAPDLLPRLFQKFATGDHRRGTGLGLAFCRLAVEAHGGSIGVLSTPGQGATFSFSLPLA